MAIELNSIERRKRNRQIPEVCCSLVFPYSIAAHWKQKFYAKQKEKQKFCRWYMGRQGDRKKFIKLQNEAKYLPPHTLLGSEQLSRHTFLLPECTWDRVCVPWCGIISSPRMCCTLPVTLLPFCPWKKHRNTYKCSGGYIASDHGELKRDLKNKKREITKLQKVIKVMIM